MPVFSPYVLCKDYCLTWRVATSTVGFSKEEDVRGGSCSIEVEFAKVGVGKAAYVMETVAHQGLIGRFSVWRSVAM